MGETILGAIIGLFAAIIALEYQHHQGEERDKRAKQEQAREARAFIRSEIEHNRTRLRWFLERVEERAHQDRREMYAPDNLKPVLSLARTRLPEWRRHAWDAYRSILVAALAGDFGRVHDVYAALDDLTFLHGQIWDMEAGRGRQLAERQRQIREELPWRLEQQEKQYQELKEQHPDRETRKIPIAQDIPWEAIPASFANLQRRAPALYGEFMRIADALLSADSPVPTDD